MAVGLKDNLEMLVAVFSVGPENINRNGDIGREDFHRKLSDSIPVLFEWITSVCSKIESSEKTTPLCHPSDNFSVYKFPLLIMIMLAFNRL